MEDEPYLPTYTGGENHIQHIFNLVEHNIEMIQFRISTFTSGEAHSRISHEL